MSRSFFPTCSSQKVEMEEMSKELDDLRAEVEALTAQLRAKSDLADGLKRAAADQSARLRDTRAESDRHAAEAAARGEEAAAAGERCGALEARLAEKEQALRQLCAAHEALKGTLREKIEGLEADKSSLLAALDDAEARRAEQEAALRARDDEVARLRGLLSEKERKCGEVEKRALVPREVVMRDDVLVKLEEEKATVEGKLKWKTEQFRHLEEALKKVQDDFKAAKREWGSDRLSLVDRIGTLEANLDSKTRVAEDFRSRLEMCSQALAHEEGRRKRLEAEMSELRHMYGNVVSEYEETKSMVESLSAKRDGEIASLRSSLAEKVTLLKEMGYSKAHLEQQNEDLRSTLKEYQEAQIGGADAVVSLKALREKFRDLEQTHRSCTEKLRDKESEWRTQMDNLGCDLDGCLSRLESKDTVIREMQIELLDSYRSLEQQTAENWEALIILTVVESKFRESCSCIDDVKRSMWHHCEEIEKEIASARKQLEEKTCIIVQSEAELKQQSEEIAKLHARIEELEHMEQEHKTMQRQLDAYKEMLNKKSKDVHCLKDEASEKENILQEKLREALAALDEANCALADRNRGLSQLEINLHQQKQSIEHLEKVKINMETELEGYMKDNCILKRDLDAARVAEMEAKELLRQEKMELLRALDEVKCALSEKNTELTQYETNFHQQKQALDNLKKLKVDMETELKTCMDENCVLKRDLDIALIAKMEAEEQEKMVLLRALDEVKCTLSERNTELTQYETNFHQQKQALDNLKKLKVDMETELKTCMDENCVLKRDLDVALIAKMEAEESYTKEKEDLCGIINRKGMVIDELQQYIALLEEESIGHKLDLGSLIKMEYEKSVQEVNNRYSGIAEVFDKKLLELEERLSFFEQKFTRREQEIMEMFDQEEADWYTLIAEKEIAISDIQRTVESVQLDIKHHLEAAAAKVTEVQLEVKQLYGFAETLNSLNIIQEHDTVFKDVIIAECESKLESLHVSLVLERQQSGNLKNLIEQLKAQTAAEMLQKAKEHQEVTNKLRLLEESKETSEKHLGELKCRTTNMSKDICQERNQLVDELTGLTNTIGEEVYEDEKLMLNFKRIVQKLNDQEPCNDRPSSEKTTAKPSAPLIKNKPGHVLDRRSPLQEHNY